MVFLLGSLHATRSVGSRRRIDAKRGGAAWRSVAPVRQLFWRARSRLRNAVLLQPRRGAVRFGYDLKSYSQNFDDGLVSGHRF